MSDLELGCRQAASENFQEVDDNESIPAHSKTKDVDPKGYPSLAKLMAGTPELAIVRSFKELNILNLLRLQAELHELEMQLERLRNDDLSAGGDRENYYRDFYLMREAIGWANSPENEQYRLLLEISTKLGEYNAALIQLLKLRKVQAPSKYALKALRAWVYPPEDSGFPIGSEYFLWKKDEDLVTLFPSRERDVFATFIEGTLLTIYHKLWGRRDRTKGPTETIREYDDKKLTKVTDFVAVVLSSLLPTLVILVLYFVKRMLVRIGLIILFTAIFSASLSLFTMGNKVEIFSATAAFAAVEVVFVGSAGNGTAY